MREENQISHSPVCYTELMMGYGGMSGGTLGLITWIVILADLVLLGVWLWHKISK